MADYSCSACEDLRQDVPEFIVKGFTDEMCVSLQNDTGLSPENDNDDCKDLNNLNDCLIGNMEKEVDSYNVCDWKPFAKRFIGNLWTTLKAMICAICGIWTNVHRLDCTVDYLANGTTWSFGENTEGKESKLVPGKGCDFTLRSDSDQHASDVAIVYVGGSVCYLHGSLMTFTQRFTDANGTSRAGNSVWNFEASNYDLPNGGELLYEVRIKKSEYPMIKRLFRGEGWNAGTGQAFFQTGFMFFDGDNIPEGSDARYAYGQHGWCNTDGTPTSTGYDSGHPVERGWIYYQCRLLYVGKLNVGNRKDGAGQMIPSTAFSPHGYAGIRINSESIGC